ncbi:MAG TPA: hypothetical protein PL193_17730 [Xanthobacteraceae bacterium]|nr:hypothetical protein [Xanthobacteraceae bacterium]
MAGSKPWFLVMTPKDANGPGADWKREHAASRGKIVARPIAKQGWIALAIFVACWTAIPMILWIWGYAGGRISFGVAILSTIALELAAIGVFLLVVRLKSTRIPLQSPPRAIEDTPDEQS